MAERGRPTVYTEEAATEICERLSAGESLRAICRDIDMPESTVRRWAIDDAGPGFSARYAYCRSIGLDCIAESLMEIADDKEDDPNSRRIRVDVRKWFLSKLRPDKYGDKTALEHSGGQEIKISITSVLDTPESV